MIWRDESSFGIIGGRSLKSMRERRRGMCCSPVHRLLSPHPFCYSRAIDPCNKQQEIKKKGKEKENDGRTGGGWITLDVGSCFSSSSSSRWRSFFHIQMCQRNVDMYKRYGDLSKMRAARLSSATTCGPTGVEATPLLHEKLTTNQQAPFYRHSTIFCSNLTVRYR